MAALTFFLATSASGKQLSREELTSFIQELLQEGHVLFPAAIFVGNAHNEPRGDDYVDAVKNGRYVRPSDYIIPNAPDDMLSLARRAAEENAQAAKTLWFFGENEKAFFDALAQAPLGEKDLCICFYQLSNYLDTVCGWNKGAVIYALTRPFPTDFMDITDVTAFPLIHYNTAHFFVLSSFCLGGFPDLIHNPLRPILARYYGPDLDMQQTKDQVSPQDTL